MITSDSYKIHYVFEGKGLYLVEFQKTQMDQDLDSNSHWVLVKKNKSTYSKLFNRSERFENKVQYRDFFQGFLSFDTTQGRLELKTGEVFILGRIPFQEIPKSKANIFNNYLHSVN